ncbi:MAG: efflux transporter outer membrane subunit [Acidobacteriota bacterium]|nr:efflux transporter outer membrane subunit [Acidobacteriota bacterium]
MSQAVRSRLGFRRLLSPRASGLLGLLGALGLTACGHSTAVSPEVGVEVPERWTAEAAISEAAPGDLSLPALAASDLPEVGFDLGEPALAAVIEEALEGNRDLAAAAARLDQAAARARIAGADLWPQASAGFDANRSKRNFIGFPIPGSGGDEVLSSTSTTFGVALNVSWEPDLWGRVRAGRDAANADLAAAQADFVGARRSLAAQTAKAWLAAVEAAQQRSLAQVTLENREDSTAKVRRRYEAGLRSPLDLRLAQASDEGARASLAARRAQLDAALRQLEVLLGRYPAARLELAGELPRAAAVPAGLPSELVTRRPDVQAAERRLVAAGARVAEARASLYPRITLTGSTGTSSEQLENLLDGDFSVWSLAGSILQPLFQGGRLRAGVDLARATEAEGVAAYAGTVLRAFAEVETNLAATELLRLQEEALEGAVEQAVAAERLAQERYGSGLADYLTVLESQRQALDSQSQLLSVRRQRLAAQIDLYLALGGDLEPSLEPEQVPSDPLEAAAR